MNIMEILFYLLKIFRFYYFSSLAKFWISTLAMVANIWFFFSHEIFIILNRKKERLLLYWLRFCFEIKDKKNSVKNIENQNFFEKESRLNYKIDLFFYCMIVTSSILLSIPYFYLSFQLNRIFYYFLTLVHYFLLFIFLYYFIRTIGNMNLMPLTILKFFNFKFGLLSKKIKPSQDNEQLRESVYEFNSLSLQIVLINQYWKYLFGLNFLFLFLIAVVLIFLLFSVNLLIRFTIFFLLAFCIVIDVFIPFQLSTNIQKEMQKCKNLLRNFIFNPEIELRLKRKINLLLQNNNSTFTCFSLFEMNSYNSFQVSFLLIV